MPKENRTLIATEKSPLLPYLEDTLKLSRKSAKALLTHRSIVVNGNVQTRHDFCLRPGDNVIIDYQNKLDILNRSRIKIVHEDDELIAINKPAGLLTVSDGKTNSATVFQIMSMYMGDKPIHIVHRLDKATSGILILSKSKRLKDALQNDWNALVSERLYYAVSEGKLRDDEGLLVSYLTEDKHHMVHRSADKSGERAETYYKVLQKTEEHTLLDIEIKTGKKNQIRIALRDIGHPIIGDKKYGSKANPLKRLCLHAYRLSLSHPITGERLSFEAKMPRTFKTLFK